MGIVIRQSVKSSLINYIGIVIGAFSVIWLFPKYLSPKEIGIINFIDSTSIVLSSIFHLGTFNIADKFFPRFKNFEQQHHGYLVFLVGYTSTGFLLFACIFPFLQSGLIYLYASAEDAIPYFYYLLPFTFVWMFFRLFEAYTRIHLRTVIPNLFKEIVLRVLIMGSIILYTLKYFDFELLVLFRILAYGTISLCLLAYMYHLKILFLKTPFHFVSKALLKEIATYGGYIVLGGIGAVIVGKIDIMMIPAFLNTQSLGIYTISFFIGNVIVVPRIALAQITLPVISQAWADKNLEKIRQIYIRSSLTQLIIGTWCFLGIWANASSIFLLIPKGEIYEAGKGVIFYIGLTRLLDMLSGVNNEILLQSKYYKFNLGSILILVFFIIYTNTIFIPWMGIEGAALATLISYFLFNAGKFIFLWIKFDMHPFTYKTLVVIALGLVTLPVVGYVPATSWVLIDILIKSVIVTVIFLGTILALKISEDINNLFLLALKTIKSFISSNN